MSVNKLLHFFKHLKPGRKCYFSTVEKLRASSNLYGVHDAVAQLSLSQRIKNNYCSYLRFLLLSEIIQLFSTEMKYCL